MTIGLILLGSGLLLVGLVIRLLAWRARRRSGLPTGKVIQTDTGAWRRPERPLFSARYRLAGRPDYLVDDGQDVIPVEVKSSSPPAQPYPSHVMQLAAYCLLVQETWSRRPPYGILQYAGRTFVVDYTSQLETELLALLSAVRSDRASGEAHRSHEQPSRCARCGYREVCDERLT